MSLQGGFSSRKSHVIYLDDYTLLETICELICELTWAARLEETKILTAALI